MVSTAGAIVIVIVVLLVVAIAAWVVFAQLRARKLGVSPARAMKALSENPFTPTDPN